MLNDEALTAADVSSILHIGRNAVYDLARSGDLPSYRIGRKLLFALQDVQAYLASQRMGGNTADTEEDTPATSDAFRVGGIGIPADLIADRLIASGIAALRSNLNSYEALCQVYTGQCDAALVHLFDQRTNSYNIPYVQRLAPGLPVIVFHMAKRWQGLIVAEGNPRSIGSWGALLRADIRLANRARGCGARILLDEKLLALEADPWSIPGYASEYPTALQAAQAVAAGAADVAVAGEHIAAQTEGVSFVPLQQEWMDLVVTKDRRRRSATTRIKSMLADTAFKTEYGRIVHGDSGNLGTIVYEC